MNKTILVLFGMLSIACSGVLEATSEIRSPLGRFGDVWFDYRYIFDPVEENSDWQVDVQKVAYTRSSARSFGMPQKCVKTCDKNKLTTQTVPLSALFFNKSLFKGQEIFHGGNLAGRASNAPGLIFSNFSPRISYEESGVSIGVHAYHQLNEHPSVRIGGRIGMPIKVIKVEEDRSCGAERIDQSVLQEDLVVCYEEQATGAARIDTATLCAYRLDYLTTLKLPNGVPMVQYGDGTPANPTKIANVIADSSIQTSAPSATGFDFNCTAGNQSNGPNAPMYLIRRSTGSMPFNPVVDINTVSSSNDNSFLLKNICAFDLPANGNATTDDQRFRFLNSNNYAASLANDLEEQSKWFVIPVPGTGAFTLNPISQEIINVIDYVVQKQGSKAALSEGGLLFLAGKGIDLCPSQRVVGAGDVEVQIYGGQYWDRSYMNAFTGFRLPVAKEHDNPKEVYFQSPGHNGHFEMMFGVDGGVVVNSWFAFTGDIAYHHVFSHTERRAAPFTGSTIRNIGPALDADVSWGWLQANAVGTFFHPKDTDLGCTLGYEFYAKLEDDISLCTNKATDLLGSDFALDGKLLEKNTNSQTHKVRGTGFYRIGYAEFMFGMSYILAGKNAMRESEWHIGMNVSF